MFIATWSVINKFLKTGKAVNQQTSQIEAWCVLPSFCSAGFLENKDFFFSWIGAGLGGFHPVPLGGGRTGGATIKNKN